MSDGYELDESESVLLLRTANYMRAQFLIGALEEEEIPFLVKGLGGGDLINGAAITSRSLTAAPQTEIYVGPDDYERAKGILESLEGAGFQDLDEDDEEAEEDEEYFEEDDDR